MTSAQSEKITVPGLQLRCASLAGLFEGLAIVRYQVLQGDPSQAPLALLWLLLFVGIHLLAWCGLGLLARRVLGDVGALRATLVLWAAVVVIGRALLRDRMVPGLWLPAIAGLILIALLPRSAWRTRGGRPGEAGAYLAILLVGTTSLLGLIPDDSHSPREIVAFLGAVALAAVGLLLAVVRWPRTVLVAATLGAVAAFAFDRVGSRPDGPNVLFVLLDTTRRDHVAPFGDLVFDQTVARLATGGVRFDQAVTVVPKTPESVASFWTGVYPHRHGVRGLYDRLDSEPPTLAELFGRAGYSTAGLIDNGWLTRGRGFARGFQRFRGYYELTSPYGPMTELSWWRFFDQLSLRRIPRFSPQVSASRMADAAIEFIERDRGRPFFLYAHFFEPHWPYFPPEEQATRYGAPSGGRSLVNFVQMMGLSRGAMVFQNPLPEAENEKARRLYRGEVDDTLAQVGRVLEALDRLGLTRDTIVVFTADHGHSLGEHSYYFHHGEFLYDDSVRIPLVLSWPGHLPAGRVISSQARSIDVAPTLLQLSGVPGSRSFDGRNLERMWSDDAEERDLPAFIESDVRMFEENLRRDLPGIAGKMRALRTSTRKLVLNPRKDGLHFELFDLESDPGEIVDLANEPAHLEELLALRKQLWAMIPSAERESLLAAIRSGSGDPKESAPSRIGLDQLRSLGYIN